MMETTGATRHIYTAAAVAARQKMTADKFVTRQEKRFKRFKKKTKTFSPSSRVYKETKSSIILFLLIKEEGEEKERGRRRRRGNKISGRSRSN